MSSKAIVFPGQGSQATGMLSLYPDYQEIVDEVLGLASEVLGYSMAELIAENTEDRLNQTEYTQPALLCAGTVVYQILSHKGLQAEYLAGHSLGEYTAIVASGALSLADGLQLVQKRGQIMQEAVAPGVGAMVAVLKPDFTKLEALCQEISTEKSSVEPANYNSPKQVVVSGHAEAVAQLVERVSETGAARAVPLPVSIPSHCRLMRPAAEQFSPYIQKVAMKTPQVCILPNVKPTPSQDVEFLRHSLIEQLYSPVRWIQTIQTLAQHNISQVIESGPGQVLSKLTNQIESQLQSYNTSSQENLEKIFE